MKVLAIETSCDDTSVALIKARKNKRASFDILSNIISSQIEIHKKWGGVYPTLAKREHQKNLIPVLEKALKRANEFKVLKKPKLQSKTVQKILEREPDLLEDYQKLIPKIQKPKIDAIATTIGPGLEPCLWVGINFARALACSWNLPLIPVNHIEAHIYANYLTEESEGFIFPAISLIVSGGHTQLILMENHGKYSLLGETRDDAAGECLDKIARILGLDYPGGPIIEEKALKFKKGGSKTQVDLPRPMIHSKDYDFSFSGLKTAVLYDYKKRSSKIRKSKNYIRQIAHESQQAIIDVLIYKTIKAAKNYRVKSIILGGGVVANNELRKQFKEQVKNEFPNLEIQMPSPNFCTDNAAMTAVTSHFHLKERKEWKNIKAKANLKLTK